MRDPERIDEFCEELKRMWHKIPDWRFGQIFCNLQRLAGNDLFYVEDARILDILDEMMNEYISNER